MRGDYPTTVSTSPDDQREEDKYLSSWGRRLVRERLRLYYRLTKPGIIYGNLLTATGGFLLAAKGHIDFALLLAALAGIAGVIASACVCNNYLDRGIDKHMARTKKRALVTHAISPPAALLYAAALGTVGFGFLVEFTNNVTVLLGVLAFVSYVALYGYAKRRSVHGTLVGSVPGSLPLVAGYTAVRGQLDAGAIILFVALACWQMAHFYAIAIFRLDDYTRAKLPVMPVVKGARLTKQLIVLNIAGFTLSALALSVAGYTGMVYSLLVGTLGMVWLFRARQDFSGGNDALWARRQFMFSLIVLLAFSSAISVAAWLP